MITIAGSGPSVHFDYGWFKPWSVDVVTKKRDAIGKYVACRFGFNDRTRDETPLMLFYRRGIEDVRWNRPVWFADSDFWLKYFKQFVTRRSPPQKTKPSSGCCAVMMVMQRWAPERIGLIGFDNVLDGNPDWEHDAEAERECILSLTEVVDLRTGETLNKGQGCSHYMLDSTQEKPPFTMSSASQS